VDVTSDGHDLYTGPAILTAALIGRQTGGGFAFAPHATFDQGVLHAVIGGNLTPAKIGRAALQLLGSKPLEVDGVTTHETTDVEMSWASPIYAHLDGDAVGPITRAHLTVKPLAIALVIPRA
jgi:diacylglycerol kinase family enzyme